MESRKGRIRSALSFLGFMDVLLERDHDPASGLSNSARPKIRFLGGVTPTGRTFGWSEKAFCPPPTLILGRKADFPLLKGQFRPKLAFLNPQMR